MWKHVRNFAILSLVLAIGLFWYFSRPDVAQIPEEEMIGKIDILPAAREEVIPTINVAEVDRWQDDEKPVAAAGLQVEIFASELEHPRSLYTLPNGDILVAETNSQPRDGGGIEGFVMNYLLGKAGAGVKSADRISLLRDADGDGKAELKSEFLTGLKSPFGMALVGGKLYVANTDALMAFPYTEGDTKIEAAGEKIYDLNGEPPNTHWTRGLLADPDGTKLYISVGSNSNIGENGMELEKGRAQVIEYTIENKKSRTFAAGLRNPVGMDFDAGGSLWAVVNERDMLGSDLVPDYLTKLNSGEDFGWPHHYWGGYTDFRVKPRKPEKRQYEKRPEFALGAHVAPLGLVFSNSSVGNAAQLGDAFANGAFIARHGSINRVPFSGYDVVFVKFNDRGQPAENKLTNVLTGFLDKDDNAQGRPTMLTIAKDGALLVSDDVGNRIWRVTAAR